MSAPRILASLALAAAAGCSTLPTLAPDGAGEPSRVVQLEGARGPLSAQRSKAILAGIASHGEETGIFDRHLAREEEVAGSPLVVGNKVSLLQDGPATYDAMLRAIAVARDHIHMETYIIEDDEVGRRFADALVSRRAQGIPVTFIYDSAGSSGTPKAFFERLADAGVEVLEFNPLNPLELKKGWTPNQRDHRKLLIVDGRVAFVGGVNISSVYSKGSTHGSSKPRADGDPPWRDTHLRIEGPVVAEFQKLFMATWDKQGGAPMGARIAFPRPESGGNEVVRAIGGSPDAAASLVYATLISAIGSAETAVSITNAYFVPDPQFLRALEDAAARGVDVKLILPATTDSWLMLHAGRSHFTELLEAGVKIYTRRDAVLHAKTASIDGVWSTVGSSNLDWRSFLHNDEVIAIVLGKGFAQQMETMFEGDLANSDLITLESWGQRPLGDRAAELAGRVWEYWL